MDSQGEKQNSKLRYFSQKFAKTIQYDKFSPWLVRLVSLSPDFFNVVHLSLLVINS